MTLTRRLTRDLRVAYTVGHALTIENATVCPMEREGHNLINGGISPAAQMGSLGGRKCPGLSGSSTQPASRIKS